MSQRLDAKPDAAHVGYAEVKNGAHTNGATNGATNGVTNGNHTEAPWQLHDVPIENQRPIKVIVIGAGYSGVYCAIRIPERLRNCELVIYEKNAGIGGTW